MSFPKKTNDDFQTKIRFENGKCFITISGKFDWMAGLVDKGFDQAWEKDITRLEIDCRDLIPTTNKGNIGTAFMASLERIRRQARKRRVKLLIYFKSRKQVTVFTLLAGKVAQLKNLKKHLVFDNPD